jgi:ribosomal protein L24
MTKEKLHVKIGDTVTVISGFHKMKLVKLLELIKNGKIIVKELILNMLNQIPRMKLVKLNSLKLHSSFKCKVKFKKYLNAKSTFVRRNCGNS